MRGEGHQIVSININNGSGSFFMRDEANEEQGLNKKSYNNSVITVPKLELSNIAKILSPSKQPLQATGELSSLRY